MKSAPIYTARGVLSVIANTIHCDIDEIEVTLERRFEVSIPRSTTSEGRLDAIRGVQTFNPGEGNPITDHIYELVKHAG